MMNNDHSHNHDARISCEEVFSEDMGSADWANEPVEPKPSTWRDAKLGGWSPVELQDSFENERDV